MTDGGGPGARMAAGPSSMSDNAARGVRAREEEGGVILMSDTSQGLLQRQRDAEDTDWRDHAACRDADPDLFFPIGTAGESLLQIDEARQICRACPVCGPCLRWAVDSGSAGVWGGTTEDERRILRRQVTLR
jgi:WhiB family transcriptional regulator, redox-sensing transcriptional regulator